jgi:perosamine synthetase
VVTDDAALAERLRLLRNLAFASPRFLHLEAGYNFRMTGYQAAMGVVQTGKIEAIIARKRRIAGCYHRLLEGVAGLQLPGEAPPARHVHWMYAVALREGLAPDRDRICRRLWEAGIETRTFFCPMNQQPCLRAQPGFRSTPCPVADRLWQAGFYLPSSTSLTDPTIQRIAAAVRGAMAELS